MLRCRPSRRAMYREGQTPQASACTDLAHRVLGRMGAEDSPTAGDRGSHECLPARWSIRPGVGAAMAAGDLASGEGHLVCGGAATAAPGDVICASARAASASTATAHSPSMASPSANAWRPPGSDRPGGRRDLRPVRQCRAHRAGLPHARRGRLGHRGWTHRHLGGDGEQTCAGARHVVITDRSDERLTLARASSGSPEP